MSGEESLFHLIVIHSELKNVYHGLILKSHKLIYFLIHLGEKKGNADFFFC